MFNGRFRSLLCPAERVSAEQLETDRQIVAFDRAIDRLTRRGFMGGLAGAAALVAGAGFIDLPKGLAQTTTSATPPIPDVLNFALNLEYLEANLYAIVTSGTGISATLSGTSSPTITGSPGQLTLDTPTMALFKALAADEENHINDLRTAITTLGGTPIAQPAINYAAKGAITTQAQLLATARQFTALGNSAYAGAAQFLVSNATVLTTAAQILGAEGQHLGAVNYQCITQGDSAAFSTNSAAYIDPLDQPPNPTQYFTVILPSSTNTVSSATPPGIGPYRTTSQDLGVVYGASTPTAFAPAGVTKGGFFPNGVNGNITST